MITTEKFSMLVNNMMTIMNKVVGHKTKHLRKIILMKIQFKWMKIQFKYLKMNLQKQIALKLWASKNNQKVVHPLSIKNHQLQALHLQLILHRNLVNRKAWMKNLMLKAATQFCQTVNLEYLKRLLKMLKNKKTVCTTSRQKLLSSQVI